MKAFELCAGEMARKIGLNAMVIEKQRVNFAADRTIPFGWAAQFMTIMGIQQGIKQVNLVMTADDTPPPPGGPEAPP